MTIVRPANADADGEYRGNEDGNAPLVRAGGRGNGARPLDLRPNVSADDVRHGSASVHGSFLHARAGAHDAR